MIPLFSHLDQVPPSLQGGVIAVGNFDGVHRGHGRLVSQVVRLAEELGTHSLVVTFDPPPSQVLRPDLPFQPPLTTLPRRAELLEGLGVRALLALPTKLGLLELSAREFFEQILLRSLNVRGIVEGPNFRFGKDRQGDVVLLQQLCSDHSIRFVTVQAVDDQQGMISSSRIRQLISAGEMAEAVQMLDAPYRLTGLVVRGAGRGRTLGFPTANLEQVSSLIPGHGVYAGRVSLDGTTVRAAVNIGPNPTFDEQRSKVEVHLLELNLDLYGKTLNCDLLYRIRQIVRFENKGQLFEQIHRDVADVAQKVQI